MKDSALLLVPDILLYVYWYSKVLLGNVNSAPSRPLTLATSCSYAKYFKITNSWGMSSYVCLIKPSTMSLSRRNTNAFQPVETKLSKQNYNQLFHGQTAWWKISYAVKMWQKMLIAKILTAKKLWRKYWVCFLIPSVLKKHDLVMHCLQLFCRVTFSLTSNIKWHKRSGRDYALKARYVSAVGETGS